MDGTFCAWIFFCSKTSVGGFWSAEYGVFKFCSFSIRGAWNIMDCFWLKSSYRTRAIISRGLYIFYPIFEDYFFVFKEVFSQNSVLMQRCRWDFKSRWASSNVVGIICPPGCNRVNGWAKVHPAHPPAASLYFTLCLLALSL